MYNFYMKKILVKFLSFIVFCCVFQYPCTATQTQPVKYSNTAIQVYNAGVAFHKQGKYELAEQKYHQALKLQPNFDEAKKNLTMIYQNLACKNYSNSDYEKALYYAKKYLSLNPDNVNVYHSIAQSYLALNNYQKANEVYEKILSIDPNDKIAQQNLKYVNFKHSDKILNDSINNLNIGHIAPEKLYRLITIQPGINSYYFEKMKTILDLIWNDPNGKILLSALLKRNTSINITNGYVKANVKREQKKKTLYLWFIIPVASFTTNSSVNINFPTGYIDNFNNKKLYSAKRIYNLQVFIHEFGHAFIGIKNPKNTNSIEEELGVSMIGYNIANKIITGKYLDSAQTEKYSLDCLAGLLSDEHRDLPYYSGFNKAIQSYGIAMPHPEVYSNISLMYKKLLSEGKVAPIPNL